MPQRSPNDPSRPFPITPPYHPTHPSAPRCWSLGDNFPATIKTPGPCPVSRGVWWSCSELNGGLAGTASIPQSNPVSPMLIGAGVTTTVISSRWIPAPAPPQPVRFVLSFHDPQVKETDNYR